VGSVSFDRAAAFYDETRALPAPVLDAVADLLSGEVAGRGPCLEIGIGTGRIALPLTERGVRLVGVDLARAMLAVLAEKARGPGRVRVPVSVADATRMPFPDRCVGAVLASHVFHLISEWRAAADEAVRVLRPGGVLLVDLGGSTPAPWSVTCEELAGRHGIEAVRPGTSSADELAEHLGDRVRRRALSPVPMPILRSLGRDLDDWERQIHAWTWPYPPEQIAGATAEIRRWAAAEGVRLDEEVEIVRTVRWWAFDLL
jgi:SAM-dependent methyltransferase